MLILGYCAGLRVGEFTRLALADFRPDDGTIEIRNTKFFKSRRLPLTASVVADLERYVAARQQAGASQEPAAAQPRTSGNKQYRLLFKKCCISRKSLRPL